MKFGRRVLQSTLLRAYGEARLPRYTSYPTAPLFSAAVDADAYADWLAALTPRDPVSLYLHVPFCRSMCWYCGCNTTISARDEPIANYLDVLRREIEMVSSGIGRRQKVKYVHFGGGTPTIMKPAQFISLVHLLRDRFDIVEDAELAIEIDPRTITREMLAAMRGSGINRASLGVQTFDPKVQQSINRIQSVESTGQTVTALRRVGITRINFDLIYGLPNQTVQSCVETVKTALTMKPDRLAVFGYAHVPDVKKHQRLIDVRALPDSSARVEQTVAIADALVSAGYKQIGLDCFALPGDELGVAQASRRLRRNFQGYTSDDCEALIGFGASAIGKTKNGYIQNETAIGNYSSRILGGRLATARGYTLTTEDRGRAQIIERLMCDFEANIPAICAEYDLDQAELTDGNERLSRALDEGLAEMDGDILRIQNNHRYLVRVVAAAFDAYLERSAQKHSKAV
jgi:oxygen-independent coproporphyrinogen-3 oxidase